MSSWELTYFKFFQRAWRNRCHSQKRKSHSQRRKRKQINKRVLWNQRNLQANYLSFVLCTPLISTIQSCEVLWCRCATEFLPSAIQQHGFQVHCMRSLGSVWNNFDGTSTMRFSLIGFQDDFILFTSSYMVIQLIQVVPLLFRPNSLQSFLLGRHILAPEAKWRLSWKEGAAMMAAQFGCLLKAWSINKNWLCKRFNRDAQEKTC